MGWRNVQKSGKFNAHYLNLLASNVNLHFYPELCEKTKNPFEEQSFCVCDMCRATGGKVKGAWEGEGLDVADALLLLLLLLTLLLPFSVLYKDAVNKCTKTKQEK